MLLLQVHRYCCEYTAKVIPYIQEDPSPHVVNSGQVRERIRKLALELDEGRQAVRHAAAAIALHNIDKAIWDPNDGLDKERRYQV